MKHCTQYKLFCGCNQSGSKSAQIYQKTADIKFIELLISFRVFLDSKATLVHWGVSCSFIKNLAEIGLLNDRQKRGCNQSGSSLFLHLSKVSLGYILLLLLIFWNSDYLASIFEAAELLYLFS